jgi:hypothetical protein
MTGAPEGCLQVLGVCAGAALLAVGLGACRGDTEPGVPASAPASANGCVVLEAGEIATLDAEVRVLASGQSAGFEVSPLAPALITDGGDVYWYDGNASVFVQRQDEAVAELMRNDEGPSSAGEYPVVLGITASTDRLYVGDGFKLRGLDYFSLGDLSPPSRLFSISKQDGRAELLLELRNRTLTPIAADSERVIVFATGRDSGYYQVRLADLQLQRLPLAAPFRESQLVGEKVYWLNGEHPPSLLRSGFDDVEPELVMRMAVDDYFFSVGPDYILTREAWILPGYRYPGQEFVLHYASDCRALPAPRGNFFVDIALDAKAAYYYRYRVPPELTLPIDEFRLFRVDVESGVVAQLNTPGFTAEPDVQFVGQDDARIFLRSNGTLVAVQKP